MSKAKGTKCDDCGKYLGYLTARYSIWGEDIQGIVATVKIRKSMPKTVASRYFQKDSLDFCSDKCLLSYFKGIRK